MNCIEKMYKEIEEILLKEKMEASKLAVPIREIKHGFSSDASFLTEPVEASNVDYLSEISLGDEWVKKPFELEKAKQFVLFIFKKFFCFNKVEIKVSDFIKNLEKALENESDLLNLLTRFTNSLIDDIGVETEEIKTFFTNPYNALFKDEGGYYAVIKNGKFGDVKRPFGFNPNQLKKVIKETFDIYANDFKGKFRNDKEYNTFINTLKAEVNKSSLNPLELEKACEDKLISQLVSNGVSKDAVVKYLETKGLSLVKQGNYYFRKKAYEEFAEYKKIEFRY